MPRSKPQPKGHRDRLLPVVAAAFAQLGYRRATTAELAHRCHVRENVLYRVWPTKKDMFLAAIDYVSGLSLQTWRQLLAKGGKGSAARRVLEYEAVHHGDFGLYRIVFAGLGETDDPAIREALRQMYLRFHHFIVECIQGDTSTTPADADLTAWAFVGIGTVSNISRELALMTDMRRRNLFQQVGNKLLEASSQ
jgi:AcrR family transcriptional regulator